MGLVMAKQCKYVPPVEVEPIVTDVDNMRIVVVGLGGVGSVVARYLAIYLAHKGYGCSAQPTEICLVDGDSYEEKNMERMAVPNFGNKAEAMQMELKNLTAETECKVSIYPSYITPKNIDEMIGEEDVVMLCVDNHKTRKQVSDHMAKLDNACLISGGNDGVGIVQGQYQRGTWGNVQIHLRSEGEDETPPIDHYHPEIKHPRDMNPKEREEALACGDAVAAGIPQVMFTNLATASTMLNAFFLYASGELAYSEACFDVETGKATPVDVPWEKKKTA